MLKPGMCSITLRQLEPSALIALVQQAGLDAIEWGGDVHVPPGDTATAAAVRKMTEEAGITVSSYGSYWKVIDADGKPVVFEPVLESALALGTDTIRVWAGDQPSDALSPARREVVVAGLRSALNAAEEQGIKLALEFHADTLADSNAAAVEVLSELNHPNLYTYWQPIYWLSDPTYRVAGLKQLADRVLNMHIFHWRFRPGAGSWGDAIDRRPLTEGAADWSAYLSVPLNPAMEHYGLIEFVHGDSPEQFLQDAAVLKSWLENK